LSKGYDSDLMIDLLLDIQMREGSGTKTQDWAKPHHKDVTLNGAPTWIQGGVSGKLNYLKFALATSDFISIAQADSVDLNFTTEDFSGAIWMNSYNALWDYFMYRQRPNWEAAPNGGWSFQIMNTGGLGSILVETTEAGPTTVETHSKELITSGVWHFLAFTRDGTSIRTYIDGVDQTDVEGTHNAILTCGNEDLTIGRYSSIGPDYCDCDMHRPRIWGRTLSPQEIKFIYNSERVLLGV